jgi:uncharacterized membrane protein YbhN (UPF0104 family)
VKNFLLKNKKTLLIVFVVTIAVVCLAKVLLEYQWGAIWQALQKSDFSLFLAGSIFSIIFYWLCRALRWQILLRGDGIVLPFWQIYLVTGVSVGSSTVTPFQSGEALKVEYLRKHGAGRLSGYTIFFLERLLDLLTVVGLGVLGVSLGFDFGIPHSYFYIFALVFVAIAAAMIAGVFHFPSERLNPVRVLLREKREQKWTLGAAAVLTVLSWLMVIIGWKIALSSVSIDINFLQASSVVSLTTLLVIMSFVPGAVGVSELGISTILTKMGIENSLAQTGAIAVRGYALMILGLTVLHWIILKILSKRVLSDTAVGQQEAR